MKAFSKEGLGQQPKNGTTYYISLYAFMNLKLGICITCLEPKINFIF